MNTYSNLNMLKIYHVVLKTLNYEVPLSFKYFLQKFEEWRVLKNAKTFANLLDTYSNLNLMKICHVVLKTLNYDIGISFKYFLWKIWGVWSRVHLAPLKNENFGVFGKHRNFENLPFFKTPHSSNFRRKYLKLMLTS